MSKNLKQLVNHALKVATGRQLSKKDLEKARKGFKREANLSRFNAELDRRPTSLNLHEEGEQIMSKRITYEYMTTPDLSEGWRRPHTGWYPVCHYNRIYDLGGSLVEKSVFGTGWDLSVRDRKIRYKPSGKWIGERAKDY